MAAAAALGQLKAAGSIPALEAAMQSLPVQEHPRLRRVIMGITGDANGKSESAALKKQMEKLEDRLRKMADRVDKLEAREEAEPSE
jgi:hypothetical protein